MKVTCISDLHGNEPELPGGDLLIVAGDWTARDTHPCHVKFAKWFEKQPYSKKIIIAGNHEKRLIWFRSSKLKSDMPILAANYLEDSGIEIEGVKFWGTPWTPWFDGINPDCDAFMLRTEDELAEKFALIPEDTEVLITHGPAYGMLDWTDWDERVGSKALGDRIKQLPNLLLHVHGHIHEEYGYMMRDGVLRLCVSRMSRQYYPRNPPVNLEILMHSGVKSVVYNPPTQEARHGLETDTESAEKLTEHH